MGYDAKFWKLLAAVVLGTVMHWMYGDSIRSLMHGRGTKSRYNQIPYIITNSPSKVYTKKEVVKTIKYTSEMNLQQKFRLTSNFTVSGDFIVWNRKLEGLPTKFNMARRDNGSKILILFYNKPSDWHHKYDSCEYNNCEHTYDRADFFVSDAILFHAPVVYRSIYDLPPKQKGQVWTYLSQEPPSEVFTTYKDWRNAFNWTWTNRRDSDLFDPYGEIAVNKKPVEVNYTAIYESKKKTAYWFVSHCKTQGKREEYIKTLKQFINIDVFGKCANPGEEKPDDGFKYKIANSYKFYLALENSLCRDYITEKVLHIMQRNTVPVIRGEPNVERYLPPGSYIDTKYFYSAVDLGLYLQMLDRNKTEYLKYFEWKKHYHSFKIILSGTCLFCKMLNEMDKRRSLYDNLDAFANFPAGKPVCNTDPKDILV